MKIVIVGCGDNGVQAFHCLRHDPSIEIVGFLDDSAARQGTTYLGLPVIGTTEAAGEHYRAGLFEGGVVAIGSNQVRKRLTAKLKNSGITIVSAIHPNVIMESPKRIGAGTIIEMGVALHPEAEIGEGVFLGGGSIVSHHSKVGDFTLIGGGVVFGGRVTIGSETLIGVGTSIKPYVTIGSGVTVGVGAAVITDLPDGVTAVGVPARIVSFTKENR